MKKWIRSFFYGCLMIATVTAICDIAVESYSQNHICSTVDCVPATKTALVLGTAARLGNGYPNPYFTHRIQAAAKLYHEGKVRYILVSGDNSRKSYNESADMKAALVELGVPEECIYEDFAGFRTLDSVVRCKKVFGQTEVVIVSQGFHNERAIFLAGNAGLRTTAFNAKDINMGYRYQIFAKAREKMARVNAVLDVIIGKKPKFLGPQITVGNA